MVNEIICPLAEAQQEEADIAPSSTLRQNLDSRADVSTQAYTVDSIGDDGQSCKKLVWLDWLGDRIYGSVMQIYSCQVKYSVLLMCFLSDLRVHHIVCILTTSCLI